jgi:hypothetical protein
MYLNNITFPENIPNEKKEEKIKTLQKKFYEKNVEKLNFKESKLEILTISPKEKHTDTIIFLHGIINKT